MERIKNQKTLYSVYLKPNLHEHTCHHVSRTFFKAIQVVQLFIYTKLREKIVSM